MKPRELLARISEFLTGNRIVVYGIKYIPWICTILMTLHVGLLLVGVYEPVTAGVSIILLLALLIFLSIRFSFCPLHKAMICFMAAMTICVCIQKYDGFGRLLTLFRLLMLGIGILLIVLGLRKNSGDGCD